MTFYKVWQSDDYHPNNPPVRGLLSAAEVAAITGSKERWIAEYLSTHSFLRTNGFHVEPELN